MRFALLLALVACGVSSAYAQDHPLVGVWKLVSYDLELKDGGPGQTLFGENPPGYIIFTAKGRVMVVLEAADRKPIASRGVVYES
jgi:Lipocalin-like domain